MKRNVMISMLAFLLAFSVQTMADTVDLPLLSQDEMNEMFGVPPDKSVKEWIRLDMLGTVNHPFPIVWVSPQKFKRVYPNHLVVLKPNEYRQFVKFGRTNQCSTTYEEQTKINLLRVTEYRDGKEKDLCVMTPQEACDYLKKMVAIPNITWTDKRLKPFYLIAGEYGCYSIRK